MLFDTMIGYDVVNIRLTFEQISHNFNRVMVFYTLGIFTLKHC